MVVRPIGLRACAAMLFSAFVLLSGLACGKSAARKAAEATTFDVSGTVKYTRIPVHYDANGVPTGYETDSSTFVSAAARGVVVRVFQKKPQIGTDYQSVDVWTLVGTTTTDSDGKYAVNGSALKGYPTFVELASVATQAVSPASVITLIADPAGVYSTSRILDRPIYAQRKALDGTVSSGDPTHASLGTASATVDFTVGLDDPWMVVGQKWWIPASSSFAMPETVAAGSRVVGILDSFYVFGQVYGNCVPTSTSGALDLHYRPGLTARRGTFVEYNPELLPLSWDGSAYHYLGAVAGGGTLDGTVQQDDAFNTNVLYRMLGRNMVYGQRKTAVLPDGNPATSLAPDLVLVEGFGDAMAAEMVKSPYLCGPTPATRFTAVRDIRDLSALTPAQISGFSAPAITALTWDLALINTKITAPGTATAWKDITPINLLRFYTLLAPTADSGTATVTTDCVSLFTQLARLQEDKGSADNSDLKTFFTDAVLTPLCAKYNVTWSGKDNAILPKYTQTWGIDPDTLVTPFPTFTMSMAQAVKTRRYDITYPAGTAVETAVDAYPNTSYDEVRYARFALTSDRAYTLRVTTVPALPAGAQIEVRLDGDAQQTYLFPKLSSQALTLAGNPSDFSTPTWHTLRIRILSPDVQVPGTQVTIHLEKKN
ncbi:hypothetical protein [Mesoterricola sediminis]|uniref:Carboxypeptidase regulatory-like domain-containing protein n=1 Tax=Mesoterricola sediminis TaxID=2927980 RepID=A0AA48KCC7_9BACT|nr:hypothetical protein [Mesoterricola sediminis]BDU75217.1 hypothetical protein METESE_01750 [Mesoterricola sediminis]